MFTSKGSPRSPRPDCRNDDLVFGMKECQIRSSETLPGSDPCIGKRVMVGENKSNSKTSLNFELKHDPTRLSACKGANASKRHSYVGKHMRRIASIIIVMTFLFSLDSLLVSFFHYKNHSHSFSPRKSSRLEANENGGHGHRMKPEAQIYDRLLNLAMSSLAEKESKREKSEFWKEQHRQASTWKPCADRTTRKNLGANYKNNGYILVSANGGLNQQRVAICNSVAVASLLNATLILPRFLFSNVWKDPSQFADIYQEEYFMEAFKAEVRIVKEIPPFIRSVDIEAIGSLITDADLVKEAKPVDYIRTALPLLLRNRVVHFLGFGNRLGFDPMPHDLQRLRCKCNYHALKFVPKIQRVGSLLVSRIRKKQGEKSFLEEQLYGNSMDNISEKRKKVVQNRRKYLALHLRFEVDMVAYSLCEFGGGEYEQKELQAYRKTHFPLLVERLKNSKHLSPEELRKSGRCPLTPEEAGLVLAGLNFKRQTYIYVAGSEIYGGGSRLKTFTDLYPNLVTKETLLTPEELAPFRNFSSQLAALDFLACASADVFALTDSGSQLSSMVSGFRTYYGGGKAPTLRPNKKILASILANSSTLAWTGFEERVKKMIRDGERDGARRLGQSIYRQPTCLECMCRRI